MCVCFVCTVCEWQKGGFSAPPPSTLFPAAVFLLPPSAYPSFWQGVKGEQINFHHPVWTCRITSGSIFLPGTLGPSVDFKYRPRTYRAHTQAFKPVYNQVKNTPMSKTLRLIKDIKRTSSIMFYRTCSSDRRRISS